MKSVDLYDKLSSLTINYHLFSSKVIVNISYLPLIFDDISVIFWGIRDNNPDGISSVSTVDNTVITELPYAKSIVIYRKSDEKV
jgi:hypothetical protein